MVGESLWKKLKNLVDFDQKLFGVEKQFSQVESVITKDKALLPQMEKMLALKKLECKNAQKSVDALELESEVLTQKEKEKKEALDRVANEKEYVAITHEITELNNKQIALESEVIKAWDKLEQAQQSVKKEEEACKQEIEAIRQSIERQSETLGTLQKQLDESQEKRQAYTNPVPPEWLERYEQMKTRVSNPIVAIVANSCGACFHTILIQDLTRIRKGGVLPCKGCYRFLYYDSEA